PATARGQLTNNSTVPSCILEVTSAAAVRTAAHFVSMDSGGFTVHFDTNVGGNARFFSLALAGMNMKSGTFNKSTVTTAPTFVQVAAKNAGAVSSTTQTFGAASTTGNTIVVSIEYDHATAVISS